MADGYGGLEPRFTCNVWISSRDEAYKVINDFASIFRGMAYYAFGTIYTVQDSLKVPRVTFTNANVENGDFTYSSVSKKVRHSIAIVRYNDPKNFYKAAIEYVEDVNAIRRYGVRELNLTAFGCTSRGQAIRLGNWALLSNNLETETIEFIAGLEGTSLRPSDVFKVCDFNRKWKRYGGRIWNINNLLSGAIPTGAIITLDSIPDIQSGVQYNLSVLTPSYYFDPAQVSGLTDANSSNIRRSFLQQFTFSGDSTFISNNRTIIPLNTGFDYINFNISGNPVYTIELGPNSQNYSGIDYFINPNTDYYRVLSVSETDINKYQVIGVQYYTPKFNQIDSGVIFESQILNNSNRIPTSPHDLILNSYQLSNSRQLIQYAFLVDNFNFITNYRVYVNTGDFNTTSVPDDTYLLTTLPADILQGDYVPKTNANFFFRIYSHNDNDNLYSASYASGLIGINVDLPINSVIISALQLAS